MALNTKPPNTGVTRAAALQYDPQQDDAPVAVAVGQGTMAQRILDTATQHKVPVVKDPALANALAQLSVGDMIPQELYTLVAEVLLYVGSVDEKVRRARHGQ